MKHLKLYTILIVGFLGCTLSFSQTFNISNITAENYPKVKASFLALKANEQSYFDLTVNDFNVVDNGRLILPDELTLSCNEPPLSIVLVVDQSGSMIEGQDVLDNNWIWAREAIKYFLEQVRMSPGSSIALTTFGNLAQLRSGFIPYDKNYLKIILDSLDKSIVAGGTNFNRAFFGDPLNPPYETGNDSPINLLKTTDQSTRRIIVFLTDGQHDMNNGPVLADSISRTLIANNIQCYGITLKEGVSLELRNISVSSGGKYFLGDTKTGLQQIYSQIADNISFTMMCDLSWDTDPTCDEIGTFHTATVNFLREKLNGTKPYRTPSAFISSLVTDQAILSFSNVNVNASEIKELKVYARNADYQISELKILPATYFRIVDWGDGTGIKPSKDIILKENDSLTLKISFTQLGSKDFRQANMQMLGSPCNGEVTLTGGTSQIVIVNPKGGELFSTCDTLSIAWAGVDANVPISLEYSNDAGLTWHLISNNAIGNVHKWMPPVAGTKYLIRAKVTPISEYKWAASAGGYGNDVGTSIAVDPNSNYLYISGFFENTATFGSLTSSKTVTSEGETDSFVAKLDQEGNLIWVETSGSKGSDSASGVACNSAGAAYTVGTFYSVGNFGALVIVPEYTAIPYFYVARYSRDGGTPSVRYIGAESFFNTVKVWGKDIYCDEANDRIYARGEYVGQLEVGKKNISLKSTVVLTKFTAIYNLNLELISASVGWIDSLDQYFSKPSGMDNQNAIYSTGSFINKTKFGSKELTSAGNKDVFVNKFGSSPASSDQIKSTFAVSAPSINLKLPTYDLGSATIGTYQTVKFTNTLVNSGSIPVEIEAINFQGAHPDDFAPSMNYIGTIIPANSSIDLSFTMHPTDLNERSAFVEIVCSCNSVASANIKGVGTCDAVTQNVDFGKVSLNNFSTITSACIFFNSNSAAIDIRPVLTSVNPAHKAMFKLYKTSDGKEILSNTVIKVNGNECFSIDVVYTPTDIDVHLAQIDYRMPTGCVKVYSNLRGESYNTDVSARPVEWGARRVSGKYDSLLTIENNSSVDVRILNKDITFLNANSEGEFELDLSNFTDANITIPAMGKIEVPISFLPKQENAPKSYRNSLVINVEFSDEPLQVEVNGNGFLPQIETEWQCGDIIKVGEKSVGNLKIRNNSQYSKLTINSISLVSGLDYSPINQNDFMIKNIDPQSEIIVPIEFSPTEAGVRFDFVAIFNDAYDATYSNVWKNTNVELKCSSLGLKYPKNIDFGKALICDEVEKEFYIENLSGDSSLVIFKNQAIFSGKDAAAFSLLLDDDLVIAPGYSAKLIISFVSQIPDEYTATLSLGNSLGFEILLDLSGKSEAVLLSLDEYSIEATPGTKKSLAINGTIGSTDDGIVKQMEIVLDYNHMMLSFIENSIKTNISDWVWKVEDLGENKIKFTGTGNLITPFDGNLLSIDFTSYLSEIVESEIAYNIVYPCNEFPSKTPLSIKLTGVCFLEGRQIRIMDTKFSLAVPLSDETSSNMSVSYGVGLEVATKIEIYNSLGMLAKTVIDEVAKTGNYTKSISISDLPTGVYLMRMTSGPFVKTQRIIIER